MPDLAGFPHAEIEFDTAAAVVNAAAARPFLAGLASSGVTDLIVFSHGWNNSFSEARDLNAALFGHVAAVRATPNLPTTAALAGRSFAVLSVLWPSKKFTDEELTGGAAAVGASPQVAHVLAQLDDAKNLFPGAAAAQALDDAKQLVPKLETQTQAQLDFVTLVRGLMTKQAADAGDPEDAGDEFRALPGDEMLKLLEGPQGPVLVAPPAGAGGVGTGGGGGVGDLGGAAGLSDFFGGIVGGAKNLLNLTTYYEMKDRAGLVGDALGAELAALGAGGPKLHLAGHSFGARVVAAAAARLAGTSTRVHSMTLLQAAFSHYGFAQNYDPGRDGFFRAAVAGGKVAGPTVITCTAADKAVGLAYPLASRLARQVASAIGDANDRYGGLGRNGAQKTPEAEPEVALGPVGAGYTFQAGRVYNLRADGVIGDHSDVRKAEVAYALLSAVAKT